MVDKVAKTRGLGRGLSALMADVNSADSVPEGSGRSDMLVPVEKIHPNIDQPRRSFRTNEMEDLAASIREKGVIQPLIVRPSPSKEGQYEIVAGERRWRAAQMAQVHNVPVVVWTLSDIEVLELAIIENIQRADLNPIEEAAGYKALVEKFGHTQEKLSISLGKSRSHIANLMRLLQLPEQVQEMVRDGQISAGHARAIITSDDPMALANKVVKDGLSVRETEKLAKKPLQNLFNANGEAQKVGQASSQKDSDTRALENDLSAAVGMKVEIAHHAGNESGKISISYKDLEQLDKICMLLSSSL